MRSAKLYLQSSLIVIGMGIVPLAYFSAMAQEATQSPSASGESLPAADPALVAARKNRTDDQAVAAFLDRKRERQTKRGNVLTQRGNAGDQQEVRRLYRALNIPRPDPQAQVSTANQSALTESLETDSVQVLQTLNFTPARIRRLSDAGLSPVQAASAYTRGTASVTDYALLSDIVAVVRVTGTRNEQLGDGFGSTVSFEVVDPIVGRSPGRPIALRQRSGDTGDGRVLEVSTDLRPADDATYLVMLSSGLYEQLSLEGGGRPAAKGGNYVQNGPVYLVKGDTLTPLHSGDVSATTLTQLKSTLASVSKAKNAADASTPTQEKAQ